MAEELVIYEVGDRFATITPEGAAKVWEVERDGRPVEAPFPLHSKRQFGVPNDREGGVPLAYDAGELTMRIDPPLADPRRDERS